MPVKACIFDWAGTTVDFGCFAPINAFVDAFRGIGIEPTIEETRKPMGMLKIEHVRAMFNMKRIKQLFINKNGRSFTDEDVQIVYNEFEKSLFSDLEMYAEPIEDVVNTIKELRDEGLKIGSTTGYTSEMMDIVRPKAQKYGYEVDSLSTSSITGIGRPAPDMIYDNMAKLGIEKNYEVVKIGDTISDIEEGVNANVWSVGILKGSSQMGLTQEDFKRMNDECLLKKATYEYTNTGADYVIDSIKDLPALIKIINKRLENNERPRGYKL